MLILSKAMEEYENQKKYNMNWINTNPDKPGKYIVKTKTMMGNTNKFESYFHGKTWSFSNQTFVEYLKEE